MNIESHASLNHSFIEKNELNYQIVSALMNGKYDHFKIVRLQGQNSTLQITILDYDI